MIGEERGSVAVGEPARVHHRADRRGLRRRQRPLRVEPREPLADGGNVVPVGMRRDRNAVARQRRGGVGVLVEVGHHAVDGDAAVEEDVGSRRGGHDDVRVPSDVDLVGEARRRAGDGDPLPLPVVEPIERKRRGQFRGDVTGPLVGRPIEAEVRQDRLVGRLEGLEVHVSDPSGIEGTPAACDESERRRRWAKWIWYGPE